VKVASADRRVRTWRCKRSARFDRGIDRAVEVVERCRQFEAGLSREGRQLLKRVDPNARMARQRRFEAAIRSLTGLSRHDTIDR